MRKTRKTAAVVALYTFLMLGSVSVVRADQPVTREQISSEQTETKTDSSAQTTESEATTETTTQTTQAKPTTEATTHTHTAATTHTTAAATHTKKHTAATHTKKQKTKSDQDKKKDKKDKKNKKKDKKSIIPKVYNDHSLEMKDKKETIQGFIYFNQADAAWNDNGYQIKSSGCGLSAMAVCISSLTNKWVTPVDTTVWAYKNGYYSSAGASHEMVPALAQQPEFLKKCPEIEITTPKRKFLYKIFSVEQASSQSPAFEYGYKLSSPAYRRQLSILKNNSMYDTGVEPDERERMVTLITCNSRLDKEIRMAVHGICHECYGIEKAGPK